MIDWPIPTFIGELYTSPNGDTWEWNGKAWLGSNIPGAAVGPTGASGLTAWSNILAIGNEALGQNIIMGGGSILSGTGQALPINSDDSIIAQVFDGINQASLNLNGNTGLLELSYIGQGRTALLTSGSSSINIDFADGIFFQQEFNMNNNRVLLKSSDFLVGGGISSLELKGDSYSKLKYDFQGDITDLSLYSDRMEYKRTTQISIVPSVIYSSINGATNNNLPLFLVNINTSSLGDNVLTLEAIITGIETTTSKSYGAKLFGTFRYFGGVLSLISTVDKIEKSSFSTATSDLVISGANINIQVTGETSSNINWCARYNYQSAI